MKEMLCMIGEKIRKYRREKQISQEELAVKLHVVRQTVSKWEKGLSVPDADVLIHMAALFEVPVSELLGVEPDADRKLSGALAELNRQLAEKIRREKLLYRANRKRGLILSFSFLAMVAMLLAKNETLSILLTGMCVFAAVIVLYRNLSLLTSVTTDDLRSGVLRAATIFDMGVLAVGIVFALLTALDVISFPENGEKMLAMALVSCVMLFAGVISPKLPYSRHTGLRLPWTVQDEEVWNAAHRILGYISLPLALLYIACAWTVPDFELVTLFTMLLWIGIPGGISYAFYRKKMSSV